MRLQYDIHGDLEKRFRRYLPNEKERHYIAREALEEWITRHEGRDKRLHMEKLEADIELLTPIIIEVLKRLELLPAP